MKKSDKNEVEEDNEDTPRVGNNQSMGKDDDEYLYHGLVRDLPKRLDNLKMVFGPDESYLDVRYGCSDIENHVAVFVEEEE